jgi:hypothetical protein
MALADQQWINVTIRVPEGIYKGLKREALRSGCSLASMTAEALIGWIKWGKKAELAEREQRKVEETRKELAEAEALLAEIIQEREAARQKRTRKAPPKVEMEGGASTGV